MARPGRTHQIVLHWDVQKLVLFRVSEHVHRLTAIFDQRHLLRQHAPVQDDPLVGLPQPLQVSLGDGPLGYPRRHVLAQYKVGDVAAGIIGHGDLVGRNLALLVVLLPGWSGIHTIHEVPGVGVVHGHSDLHGPADPEDIGEQDRVAQAPLGILFRSAYPNPAFDYSVFKNVEPDFYVMGNDPVDHPVSSVILLVFLLHHVVVIVAMKPLCVDRVQGVLHAL